MTGMAFLIGPCSCLVSLLIFFSKNVFFANHFPYTNIPPFFFRGHFFLSDCPENLYSGVFEAPDFSESNEKVWKSIIGSQLSIFWSKNRKIWKYVIWLIRGCWFRKWWRESAKIDNWLKIIDFLVEKSKILKICNLANSRVLISKMMTRKCENR